MPILYTTKAYATGGRAGHGATEDGTVDVTLTVPKELGGDGATGANPEKLFAVGYSACFLGALKAVARGEKVKVPDEATIDADVTFGENAKGAGFAIAVELKITLPGFERDAAEALVQKAHQICPYSNATRGNVDVTLTVV